MTVTADTITDAQILALFHADEIAAIDLTVATLPGWGAKARQEARALCAALFNKLTQARCPSCGGPIAENMECRC